MTLRSKVADIRLRQASLRAETMAREDLGLMVRFFDIHRSLLERVLEVYAELHEDEQEEFDERDTSLIEDIENMLDLEVDIHPENCLGCGEELDEDYDGVVCEDCLDDEFCEDCGEKNTSCVCDEECDECGEPVAVCECEEFCEFCGYLESDCQCDD